MQRSEKRDATQLRTPARAPGGIKLPVCTVLAAAFVGLALWTPQPLVAQQSGSEVFSIESIDTTFFPINYVYYRHVNEDGENAGAIWEERITVEEERTELTAWRDEAGENVPAELAIVIDSSGSMEGSMDGVLSAARDLIARLDVRDYAEIIDFDSEVRRLTSFSRDKDELRAALETVRPAGATALYDAINLARTDLTGRRGLKAVVVLTDGKDERGGDNPGRMSTMPLDSLLAELDSGPVPVYAIGLGAGIDRGVLDAIADASRGEAFYADEVDAVNEIYLEIISYLHSLYRFYYVGQDADQDGRTRDVRVQVRLEGQPEQVVETSYRAPRGPHWSYATKPQPGDRIGVVGVSPDGDQVWLMNDGIVLNREGEVIGDARREYDAYGGGATRDYFCMYKHRHYGALFTVEDEGLGTIEARDIYSQGPDADPAGDDWSPTDGTFNPELAWQFKAVSPDERYAVLTGPVSLEQYPEANSSYLFALMDFRSGAIEWVAQLYEGEFNEPGAIAVADDGTALIVQSDVMHIVATDGTVLYRTNLHESGIGYNGVAISSDGSRWVGRRVDRSSGNVALHDRNGNELWAVDSEQPERAGGIAISPNGDYVAVNDGWGLHVYNREGELIHERLNDEFLGGWVLKGVGIADDGSYAYAAGNRVIYGRLD